MDVLMIISLASHMNHYVPKHTRDIIIGKMMIVKKMTTQFMIMIINILICHKQNSYTTGHEHYNLE